MALVQLVGWPLTGLELDRLHIGFGPSGALKGKTRTVVAQRDRRQLEEVAAEDELQAAKGKGRDSTHGAANEVEGIHQSRVEH